MYLHPASAGVLGARLAAGVGAQVRDYARHLCRLGQQPTKWVVPGSAAAVVGLLLFGAILVWPPAEGTASGLVDLLRIPAAQLLRVLLPSSILAAIRRDRLGDIDLIPNRAMTSPKS
jgi:hypothetical protein